MDEERLEAATRNSAGRKESKRTSETRQSTWLGGAQTGSLQLQLCLQKAVRDEGSERDRPKVSRRVERLSIFVDGNNIRCLPDGRKSMRRPEEIEQLKKKIYARAKKML